MLEPWIKMMYSLLQAQYKNAVNEAEIAKLKAKVGKLLFEN
jgi:hypothetical protein